MRRRYIVGGLLLVLLVVTLVAAACGGTTTTTAPSTATTAAPSTDTTASPTETTAATTVTTAAAGPATGEPIKIGFSNGRTGAAAGASDGLDKGARLQIEYVNQNGGINGRPLELIEYDNKSEMPNVVADITKLIQSDKVFATIGPLTPYDQAARPLAEQLKVPMVGCGPAMLAGLAATPQPQWSILVAAGSPPQADAVTKIIQANGWKNLLGIGDVLPIHQETLDLLVKGASAGAYSLTKMPDTFGLDQQDFQPILNKMMEQIKTLKPDAILLYSSALSAPSLYRGLRALGVTVPMLAGPDCAGSWLFMMGPEAVDGLFVLDSGGMVNPAALPDSWPHKQVQVEFFDRFKAKYGSGPDIFGAQGADLVTVLVAAMKQAGELDQAKVAQALINLKDLPTLEGVMTFTPDATSEGVHGSMVEWQVKNGQWVLVSTLQ